MARKRLLYLLIFLDIFWAIAALVYDWPKLVTYPLYLWPVIIVCPLYPALLAYVWYKINHHKQPNDFIFTLAAVGSAFYGILAPIFYTQVLINEGFNLITFGAIFWVIFYGLQGMYLLLKTILVPETKWLVLVVALLTAKISLDWHYATFGYFTIGRPSYLTFIATSAYTLLAILFTLLLLRNIHTTHPNKRCRPHGPSRQA